MCGPVTAVKIRGDMRMVEEMRFLIVDRNKEMGKSGETPKRLRIKRTMGSRQFLSSRSFTTTQAGLVLLLPERWLGEFHLPFRKTPESVHTSTALLTGEGEGQREMWNIVLLPNFISTSDVGLDSGSSSIVYNGPRSDKIVRFNEMLDMDRKTSKDSSPVHGSSAEGYIFGLVCDLKRALWGQGSNFIFSETLHDQGSSSSFFPDLQDLPLFLVMLESWTNQVENLSEFGRHLGQGWVKKLESNLDDKV
ncbi:unnamed protein product [Allacma fusca]|uniref:Uncharacterized protein n=1 Tax=Allacma fusca TaxID=39272 RepID=A0A8J2L713_9HEXA|nr:unnamed protein product [Allacma fusca]